MAQKDFQLPTVQAAEDIEVVENALLQLLGVQQVTFHPESKRVTIQWVEPATWGDIERTLESLGYPVAQV
jgi:copper chaperone CopZ